MSFLGRIHVDSLPDSSEVVGSVLWMKHLQSLETTIQRFSDCFKGIIDFIIGWQNASFPIGFLRDFQCRQGRLSIICENKVHFHGSVRYAVPWQPCIYLLTLGESTTCCLVFVFSCLIC